MKYCIGSDSKYNKTMGENIFTMSHYPRGGTEDFGESDNVSLKEEDTPLIEALQ